MVILKTNKLIAIPLISSNILTVQLTLWGSLLDTLAWWPTVYSYVSNSLLHLSINIFTVQLLINICYVTFIGVWVYLPSALFHVSIGLLAVYWIALSLVIVMWAAITINTLKYSRNCLFTIYSYLVSFMQCVLVAMFNLLKLCACSTYFLGYVQYSKYVVKVIINNPYSIYLFIILLLFNVTTSMYLQYYFLLGYILLGFIIILSLFVVFWILMPTIKMNPVEDIKSPFFSYPSSWFVSFFVVYLLRVLSLQESLKLFNVLAFFHIIIYLFILIIVIMFITFIISECSHLSGISDMTSDLSPSTNLAWSCPNSTSVSKPTFQSRPQMPISVTGARHIHVRSMCSSAFTGNYTSPFTSKFAKAEFFSKLKEKDNGKNTNNRFIIANRHIKACLPPTPDIINKVLDVFTELSLNDDMMNKLANIKPKVFSYPASFEDQITIRECYGSQKAKAENASPGSYIIRRGSSAYVGGAMHLNKRPFSHLMPSRKGQCATWIRKHSKEGFQIEFYSLKDIEDYPCGLPVDLLVLFLEQYLTFLHRPDINGALVANLGTTELTPERHLQIIKALGITLYTYYKGTLIHVFSHTSRPGQLLGRGNSWTGKLIQSQKGTFRKDLFFTQTKVSNAPENLVSEEEFVVIGKNLIESATLIRKAPVKERTKVTITRPLDGYSRTYTSYTEASDGLKIDFNVHKGWSKTTFRDIKTKLTNQSLETIIHRGFEVSIKLSPTRGK